VFIETSLVDRLVKQVAPLLECDSDLHSVEQPTHAIFYAIVSTEPAALSGLDLGKTLIYAVADALTSARHDDAKQQQKKLRVALDQATRQHLNQLDLSRLAVLSTLSPMPTFRKWLEQQSQLVANSDSTTVDTTVLAQHAQQYLFEAKRPLATLAAFDPVQHFHLSNGARIESINIDADLSGNVSSSVVATRINFSPM